MPELVAIDVAQGPALRALLEAIWSRGDAACVLDHRLRRAARAAQLDALAPTRRVTDEGEVALRRRPRRRGAATRSSWRPRARRPRPARSCSPTTRSRRARRRPRRASASTPARIAGCAACRARTSAGSSVVTRALLTGHPPRRPRRASTPTAVACGRDRGATLVSLVATALARLGDPSAFRTIVLGGAAAAAVARPANVVATWGMTETGSGVVYDGVPLDGVDGRGARRRAVRPRPDARARVPRRRRRSTRSAPTARGGWLATGDGGPRRRRRRRGLRAARRRDHDGRRRRSGPPTSSASSRRTPRSPRSRCGDATTRSGASASSPGSSRAASRPRSTSCATHVAAALAAVGGAEGARRRRRAPAQRVGQGRAPRARRVSSTPPEDRVVVPPSTTTVWPVIHDAASETRRSADRRDVVDLADPPERDARSDALLVALPQPPRELGADEARREAVDPDGRARARGRAAG